MAQCVPIIFPGTLICNYDATKNQVQMVFLLEKSSEVVLCQSLVWHKPFVQFLILGWPERWWGPRVGRLVRGVSLGEPQANNLLWTGFFILGQPPLHTPFPWFQISVLLHSMHPSPPSCRNKQQQTLWQVFFSLQLWLNLHRSQL